MKKLLVLMLVLGMASIANATVLSWSADSITINAPGGTSVVQLIASDALAYPTKWVGNTPAVTPIATITMIAEIANNAGDNQVITGPASGWWSVEAADFSPPSGIMAGAQYDVTISGQAMGTFKVDSDNLGTNDVLNITVLPEPMTIGLLGIGGLFLLRRRK